MPAATPHLLEANVLNVWLLNRRSPIDFITRRSFAYAFSALLIVVSLGALAVRGLHLGLDFTGGTLLELGYPQAVDLNDLRAALDKRGIEGAVVQHFGSSKDVLIRVPLNVAKPSADFAERVRDAATLADNTRAQVRRVEYVGPQVGEELVEAGGMAILLASGAIMIYIWWRFERRLALGAVAATIHDPLAIVGFFSLTQMEFDLTVLAAVLAVIGYSVNDTIVVFDRIRENLRRLRTAPPGEVVNVSINQTLSRTILTSGTTLLVVIALLIFGGPLLRGFSTALTLGILVGTYSSIYIAAASALDLGLDRSELLPVVPDARP